MYYSEVDVYQASRYLWKTKFNAEDLSKNMKMLPKLGQLLSLSELRRGFISKTLKFSTEIVAVFIAHLKGNIGN